MDVQKPHPSPKKNNRENSKQQIQKSSKPAKKASNAAELPIVTPIVSRNVQAFFHRTMEVTGKQEIDAADRALPNIAKAQARHESDPDSMEWGIYDKEAKTYASITMDGVVYEVRLFLQ